MNAGLKFAAASLLLAAPLAAIASPAPADSAELDAFARCVAASDTASASELLGLEPGSGDAGKVAKRLTDKKANCAATLGKGRVDEAELRGALAERLYLDAYATPPVAPEGPPEPFQGSGDPDLARYDITRCAATRDPVGADTFLRAPRGTDAEKAALAPVVAAVGNCTPSGARIGFSRVQLRGMVAEGLYKIRSAPAVVAQ